METQNNVSHINQLMLQNISKSMRTNFNCQEQLYKFLKPFLTMKMHSNIF